MLLKLRRHRPEILIQETTHNGRRHSQIKASRHSNLGRSPKRRVTERQRKVRGDGDICIYKFWVQRSRR